MRLLLPLALLALGSTSVMAAKGPEEVAQAFYTARLANNSLGIPRGRDLAVYSGYFTQELTCVLGAALRYDEKFTSANPDSKALFGDTDLYSSGNALPTRFTLGKVQMEGGQASLPVHFYHDADDTQDAQGWEDVVKLKQNSHSRWQIADIEYSGESAEGKKGRLFGSLEDSLRSAPAVSGWRVAELDSCVMDRVPARNSSGDGTCKPRRGHKHAAASCKKAAAAHGSTRTHAATGKTGKSTKASARTTKPAAKSSTKKTTTTPTAAKKAGAHK